MFTKTIVLKASRREFHFACGMKDVRFAPVVYMTDKFKVLSVGDVPSQGAAPIVARIFEEDYDDAFAVLEAMIRYGTRLVIPGFTLCRIEYRIFVGADIRRDLRGFTSGLFRQAAIHAGASKVLEVQ